MGTKRGLQSALTFAAILVFAQVAAAQTVVDLAQLPAAVRDLDPNQIHELLPCNVRHVEPALNFGLRFQTGYVLEAPLGQYRGAEHHWYLVFRVTPEDSLHRPVYFMDSVDIPAGSQPAAVAAVRGLFFVGEGRYDVSFSLLDDLGSVCRQRWTLDARLDKNDHATDAMLPRGTAAGVSLPQARALLPNSGAHPPRITVMLNTLPAAPRVVRPGQPDGVEWLLSKWGMLVSMLTSVLEQFPADSVRLVGFDLAQQRETFRQEGFTLHDINRAVHLGDVMDVEPVGDPLVPNPTAVSKLLADLVNRETHEGAVSDDVIFMGVPTGPGKIPPGFPGPAGHTPHFFYLQYRPNAPAGPMEVLEGVPSGHILNPIVTGELPNAGQPLDSVEECVRRLRGSTFTIYSSADFDKALGKIKFAIH